MAVDILNLVVSIIELIIVLWITWKILKLVFAASCAVIGFLISCFFDGLDLITQVISGMITVVFAFIIVIGALWVIFPNSFYLDVHTNNQNFDIGVPLVEFTGTYENTNDGYIIKPNIYQIPVSSTLTVKQIDKTHLNLFTDFVIAKNQPIRGVIRYVPDR